MSAKSAPQDVSKIVGDHICARREALRLTQSDLAAFARIDLERIQTIEAGTEVVNITDLLAICRVLDCTPQSLLPVAEKRAGEYVPRWMSDARALNALHPQLFDVLKRLPENRLRLMLISMRAMCQDATDTSADLNETEKASA